MSLVYTSKPYLQDSFGFCEVLTFESMADCLAAVRSDLFAVELVVNDPAFLAPVESAIHAKQADFRRYNIRGY